MPRADSDERNREIVARWLAWRCGHWWQLVGEPQQKLPFYVAGKHEAVIERIMATEVIKSLFDRRSEGRKTDKKIEQEIQNLISPPRLAPGICRTSVLTPAEFVALVKTAKAHAGMFRVSGQPIGARTAGKRNRGKKKPPGD